MSLDSWIKQTAANTRRNPPVLVAVVSSFALVLIAYTATWQFSGRSFDFWENLAGWPLNVVGLLVTLGVVWFVDSVKTDTQAIQDSLRTPMNSFSEIREEALKMLEAATPLNHAELQDTYFYMTSATPVFGLELEDGESKQWLELLDRRSKANAETQLLCYNWHALDGMEASSLGKFATALPASALRDDWRSAFVKAWKQYDRLGRGDESRFTIRLVEEPEFGIVLAKKANAEPEAIIYLSNSASVEKRKDAVAFKTTDRNWITLIKRTFDELASAPPLSFKRDVGIVNRDGVLYEAFARQSDSDDPQEMRFGDGKRLKVDVFPGVFPIESSLDTAAMLEAIEKLAPALSRVVQRGDIKRNSGLSIDSVHGVDVGTGTGVLALALSDHVQHVSATENYWPACANALFNLTKHAYLNLSCAALADYRPEAEPHRSDYTPKSAIVREGAVINCDLAKGIYRRKDAELLLFCFNYPAYPSPSNVFNTGGSRAGQTIVREFLTDMRKRFEACDFILLPVTGIGDGANVVTVDIRSVAKELGFGLSEVHSSPKHDHGDYVVSVAIYLLYRTEAKPLADLVKQEMKNQTRTEDAPSRAS